MKKRILPLMLAALLLCSGCSRLLERSYRDVQPYTNRFWENGLEDTLKAESYQDLVNTLLMLLEQRSEEGVVRFYAEEGLEVDELVREAGREVREETMLGAYLLEDLQAAVQSGPEYYTLTYDLIYREGAVDPEDLMALSDSRSLVDLLRVAIREEHGSTAARFAGGVSRQEVSAAVESLWRELCASEAARQLPILAAGENASGRQEKPPIYPPCPWEIRFYPDSDRADVVEIRFTGGGL